MSTSHRTFSIKSGKFKPYQVKSAILDLKTWMIVISIFAAGIPLVDVRIFLSPLLTVNRNGVISNFS